MRKQRSAWNKGRLLGQKPPLKPKDGEALRLAGIDSAASYLRQGEQLLHNFGHAVWYTGRLLFGGQEQSGEHGSPPDGH